ncbi:conserved unknown protein [Ectocarpus siliculosus]|uniref:Uncharacterized protein n=1 Tax=Ectocarpus siliculosus TaxID=2880 RepID=D7FIQ3_ECTSI|nr:conserved unknown protein [Ectocarpus siliculosus]|eukprot:CBJ28871.1 conserved unknown protein [Ectocarpus siliculosus]
MFDEFFAKATSAAVAAARSKQQRDTSPESNINGRGRQQESGGGSTMHESTGKGASSSSSPRGTATKRRREEEKAATIRRKPSPPRRANLSSDSSSNEGVALGGVEPRRRTKAPGSNHGPDGGTCNSSDAHGFSSPRAASLGGDACSGVGGSSGCNRRRSSFDTDDSFGDGGCGDGGSGGGGSGSRKRKPHGESSGDEMQVGFGLDNDDDFNCAAGQQREGGQNVVTVRGGEEEGETDDDLDDEGEGLKPTIRNPPFEDPGKRPLVLTNEAGGERAEVPASANRYLQGYQREGVEFMYRRVRHTDGPKGVILADDMGLGKTVQTIALLLALLKKTGTRRDRMDIKRRKDCKGHVSVAGKPVLIVCPRSVLPNWTGHLKTWGHFETACITSGGSTAGPESLQRVESRLKAGLLEVVVVGETMFANSIETLSEFDWLTAVFDEFHHYKNPYTNKNRAVQKLVNAEVFIGLTGTLVQNNLDEYWSLLNTVQPGCVGRQDDFKRHFTEPILRGRKRGASRADVLLGRERIDEMGVTRDKVVLRRVKDILGDLLKGKIGTVVFCNLTHVQKLVYRTVLSLPEFKLLANASDPCPCGRPDARSGSCCGMWPQDDTSEDLVDPRAVIWRRFHPDLEVCKKGPGCPYCCSFSAISKLQKLANHPSLLQVKPPYKYGENAHKMLDDIAFANVAFSEEARVIMADLPGQHGGGAVSGSSIGAGRGGGGRGGGGEWDRRLARPENFLQLCRDDTCGKMRTLKVLLERFKNKHKVLLFSYSTAMLDILQALCSSQGYTFLKLDGNTAKDQRQKMIDRFTKQNAIQNNVFLISTTAGGTGLNLQAASKVILYDVNWNPAQDAQAEDRAYRIGQLKEVEVFRLVSTGTIEELTYMRQIYKLQTSAATMGEKAEGGLRQFEGVQGVREEQGELWGISNLMKFSGESMLLELRQKYGNGLPPLVPDSKDGLVMEPQTNVVNIVNSYAAAGSTAAAEEDAQQRGAASEEEEDEEEEFKDDASEGGGAGGRNQNAELGGVVMRHDEMVAADREEELPPGSQESIAEVDMMDDQSTDDEAPGVVGSGEDNSIVSADPFTAPSVSRSAGAAPRGPSIFDTATQERNAAEENTTPAVSSAASATTDLGGRVQLPPDLDESRVGDVRQRHTAAAAAVSPTIVRGIAAEAGLGARGEAGAAAAVPLSPSLPVDHALGHGDGSDRGLADSQNGEGAGPSAADEPSWALAPTQPRQQQEPSSSSLASASSPSNHGGASDGARRRTVGGGSSQVRSRAGVEAAAAAAAAAGDRGGRGDVPSQRFLWAPAAQEPFDTSDYDHVAGTREEREENGAEEDRVEEDVEEAGDGGALEEAQPESAVNSSLDLDIPDSDGEDNDNGAAATGAGISQRTEDVPVVNNNAAAEPDAHCCVR